MAQSMTSSIHGNWRTNAGVLLAAAAVGFVLSWWLTRVLASPGGNIALFRPASALLLGALLLRRMPIALVAVAVVLALATQVLAMALAGLAWPPAAGAAAAVAVEVGIGYALLRLRRVDPVGLPDLRSIGWTGIVSASCPLAGGVVVAVVFHQFVGAALSTTLRDWWIGGAAGFVLVLPAMLASRSDEQSAFGGARQGESWLLGVAALAATVAALHWMPHPFVAIVAPLLLVAVRRDMRTTALVSMACTALVVGLFLSQPVLPATFALRGLAGMGPAELVASCMLVVLGPLLVAALEQQREAAAWALGSARTRLELVDENVPALVAEVGSDLRFRYANPAYCEWTGRSAGDIVGRTHAEIFGNELSLRLASRMQRALAGLPQRFDLTMPDGRDLEVRYAPMTAPEGGTDGFAVLARDVSWRRQAELRFQSLLESSPDAIVMVDSDRHIVMANGRAERLFGHQRDGMVGQSLEMLLPDAKALEDDAAMRARREAAGESAPWLSGVRNGGDSFPAEVAVSAVDAGDRPLVAVTIRDCTSRVAMEADLVRERERSLVMLNSIGDAVVACDASFRITTFNPIAQDMSGWSEEDALGRDIDEVVRLANLESGEKAMCPLRVAIRENRPVALQTNSGLVRRDGRQSPIEHSAAPVHDHDGNVVGGIMVFHDVSESRAMALKMSHLAQHDYLTDLPNRVLLEDRLSQALTLVERGIKGALLFLDLDHFKNINDTLGHQAGDVVLQEVSRRLVEAVRDDDTVSRQGGDEFVLLLSRLADPRDAARVAEKLIRAIEQPYEFEDQQLHISASIGIALFPQDSNDIGTLMKQADTALYHAKQAGRGRYSYFAGSMSERAEQRMRTEHDLRLALASDGFHLVYQPKVRMPDGRITGMEALVRWRRPDGVVVSPAEFVPVAEETGLIVQLDQWVMHEACRQNVEWQRQGLAPVPVSVNVSLAHFDADRLVAHIRDTLKETGLNPRCLEVEFTESQMFEHQDRAQHVISELKALGVQVAIDDFGTGYSSLSYLVRYRFDSLKIDRAFVSGLPGESTQRAVVQAIIGMARALDYRVVAEGVESHAQAEFLEQNGCPEMQGYLFSHPVAAEEFAAMLRHRVIDLHASGGVVLPHTA